MLSKFKILLSIFCFIGFIDVIYGNEINDFKELLDNNISLEDKLEFLQLVKNTEYSFSKENIGVLIEVLRISETSNVINRFLTLFVEKDKKSYEDKNNSADIRIKEKIRVAVLEIFLKPEIDESILTQAQMTIIAGIITAGFSLDEKKISSKRRFLSLKVLIKINMLKPNVDDEFSKRSRKVTYNEIKDTFKDLFKNQPSMEEESFDEQEALRKQKRDVWDSREEVEGFIFEPILSSDKIGSVYMNEDPKILYEYENYLLDRIKYFYLNDNLKKLVERAFLKTRYDKFRIKYIDAMFYLDMQDALLRIINNKSIDYVLRQRAIEISMKFLDQIDLLYFKKFSGSLLKILERICSESKNIEEQNKIRNNIKIVQSYMSKHDDMIDLERIILDRSISVEDKIKYLNYIFVEEGFYFSKDKLEFVKRVFDNYDIDIRIKMKISDMIVSRTQATDFVGVFNDYDMDSIVYLFSYTSNMYRKSNEYLANFDGFVGREVFFALAVGAFNLNLFYYKIEFNADTKRVLKQLYRFDSWKNIIKLMREGTLEEAKLAIKTGLDLLVKTKDYEQFSKSFLETLQSLSEDREVSADLRNIADYILLGVKKGRLSLKDGSCDIKFMF